MKRFLRSLILMMSLVGSGLALPATAQTPLLEIDYNGATIFHVLSNGRLLLPAGAQDGYVLTATDDGFASWQAVSASGGVVASNGTLSGDGTPGNPLGVTVPLHLSGGIGSVGTVYGEHSQGHRGLLGSDLFGVLGLHSDGNIGTLGSSDHGVYGFSNTAAGVYGGHDGGNRGYLGSSEYGAYGEHSNGHFGLLGSNGLGILGVHSNGNRGYLGSSDYGAYGVSRNEAGVYGEHNNGNYGYLGGSQDGVFGESNSGTGVRGVSDSGNGVYGYSDSDNGVQGFSLDENGVLGASNSGSGVFGESLTGFGVYGEHNNSGNWGALGTDNFAGFFDGNVFVLGTLSKGGGSFKIDHPLDPAGKYLSHSFVESPDMMNVYNGNVTTDENGEATVMLPSYFEALNRDFRYQLTVIGQFAQAIVAQEIQGNHFVIHTDEPNVKVSWQVTGIRQDAWAEQHRIVVEEDKPALERGFYLHPTLFGQPQDRSLMWARHSEILRELQEMPTSQEDKPAVRLRRQ